MRRIMPAGYTHEVSTECKSSPTQSEQPGRLFNNPTSRDVGLSQWLGTKELKSINTNQYPPAYSTAFYVDSNSLVDESTQKRQITPARVYARSTELEPAKSATSTPIERLMTFNQRKKRQITPASVASENLITFTSHDAGSTYKQERSSTRHKRIIEKQSINFTYSIVSI